MPTFTQLKNQALHALSADTIDSKIDLGTIVNEAGAYLAGLHRWKHNERPELQLDFISGQSFVTLPEDYGELIAYAQDSLVAHFLLTSWQHITDLRADGILPVGFITYGVISQPSQPSRKHPMPAPQLDIYPTPDATTTNAISLIYRATWVELIEEDDMANLRTFMNPLFNQIVRLFAKGYEEDDDGELYQRLEAFEKSAFLKNYKRKDGRGQPNYGPLRNGAVQRGSHGDLGYLPYTAPTIT